MECCSEAETRALDEHCGDLASQTSRRTIRKLRAMPVEDQMSFTVNSVVCNCDNLLRCALEAGVSAGSYFQQVPLLCIAALGGSLRPLLRLLAAGADPNAIDRLGNSALMDAVGLKRAECCRALLDVSELSLVNGRGVNALHVCVLMASQECFELVLPRVYDVDCRRAAATVRIGPSQRNRARVRRPRLRRSCVR